MSVPTCGRRNSQTSPPVTLTLASQIRKECFVKQMALHHLYAPCTRSKLVVSQQKPISKLIKLIIHIRYLQAFCIIVSLQDKNERKEQIKRHVKFQIDPKLYSCISGLFERIHMLDC